MSQAVMLGNETYKKRNVVGVWLGLPLVTLGIYSYVWIYKVNDEARRFLRDDSIKPGLSVLAFFPGFILIAPHSSPSIASARGSPAWRRPRGSQAGHRAVLDCCWPSSSVCTRCTTRAISMGCGTAICSHLPRRCRRRYRRRWPEVHWLRPVWQSRRPQAM